MKCYYFRFSINRWSTTDSVSCEIVFSYFDSVVSTFVLSYHIALSVLMMFFTSLSSALILMRSLSEKELLSSTNTFLAVLGPIPGIDWKKARSKDSIACMSLDESIHEISYAIFGQIPDIFKTDEKDSFWLAVSNA